MKKIFTALTILAVFCTKSFCSDFNLLGSQEIFHLTPARESVFLGGGLAVAGTAFALDHFVKLNQSEYDGGLKEKSRITMIDRTFMTGYSKGLDVTCDVARIAMLAAPVAVFGLSVDKEEWFTIGTMYAESILWTYGTTEILKLVVNRARPYMYYDDVPEEDLKNGDWNNSFPSGHTSICFATAAFTSYVFSQYYPESGWKWGVTGMSFGLATTVAALRMAGGCHYFTDVFAAALLGTVTGFIIPWYHTRVPAVKKSVGKSRGTEVSVTPMGFCLTLRK